MVVRKKFRLEKAKGVRRSDKTSVSKKLPALQKRNSENLGKTIHERRRSVTKMKEEKVEERIARLASFPELNPNPIVEIDLTGQILYLNPSAESLFPDLRSKGSNHPWIADLGELTALDQQDLPKSYLREKRAGDSWYQRVIYYTPEWNRIRIYGYDITKQKQAENLLRQSEGNYRKLFEDDLTADFIATPEGVILDCNPSFIEIFGFRNKEEALNTNFFDLYPSHAEREAFMNHLREKKKLEFYESVLLKREGTLINTIENIVGHFDEQGNLKQFKGYLFDNTEHKHAEEALRKVKDELEIKVKERTAELQQTNDRLKQENQERIRTEQSLRLEEARLDALLHLNQISEASLKEITGFTLEQAIALTQSKIGFVGFMNEDESVYTLHAVSKDVVKECNVTGDPLQWHVVDAGIWAETIRERKTLFVNDYSKPHPRKKGLPPGHPDVERFMVVPILEDERIVAVAGVGNKASEYDKSDERQIVLLLSGMWGYVQKNRSREELARANELLERMFSNIDMSVAYMDKDFNFIRVNRAYAEADGQEPEFFVGKNHFALFPNEENEQIFRKVVETGEPYLIYTKPFEYAAHPERGVTYWDWSLQPVKEADGSVGGIILSLMNVTERVQAQKTVEAERQRFNSVLEMLPAYLVLLAPDYHVPFANRFFRERFGESHGRRCFEYLFGRSEPCEVCETYTVLKTMAPHEWEWTGPDGRNYSVFDFPFTDMDGSALILEMGIDITERKRAEEALRQAALYARSLIEASLDPLVTISADGKVMDVNKETELATGVSREELIGTDFSNYFTEPEKAREGYQQVFSTGSVRDYPLAIRHVSGKVIDVLYNATLYRDEAGGVQGVFASARDITKRKQTQEALRQSEERFRNVLELLPVGIWITDKNGVITHGNPAGLQIWAGSRYVGIEQYGEYKGWWLDTGKRIESEEWAAARAVIKGETSLNEEIEIECFDGSHKIILNSAIPLRNDRKEIMGAIIINQDITERKRTEKAVRQMQKMESLGTLAGGIAHDFNNILMPIVINTELALLDTPEGSSILNYLKLIQEAANRGKDLIKQIITFSRQKEQMKVPIEIGPVIKEALKFLRASIPKTIEIRENIEVAPSSVIADPTQIHQVLMNLCSNAAYAMREKGDVLEVSLTSVEVDSDMVNRHLDLKPGPYLRLTVADTGQGMDKEVMERIFDPFFTTKQPGEGTGMGLAVVHGIVKNHGGAITVYSEFGKGSTFNVFLPMIKEELKTEDTPSETIISGKERILLIDDEKIQIRSVQPMLERLGYRVVAETDPIEALDIFRLRPNEFDLVITDQTMPRMTGRELAEEILRIRPNIPIILCTGFSEVIHEEEAKAMGIREFIMKPFSLNEMAGIIRKSLEKNG
jgi:PAS domain S-box-containing protein